MTELAVRPVFTREGEGPVPAPVEQPESELRRPRLDYDVRRRVWYVCEPYAYEDGPYTLTIPEGFTLDLASIPRPLWWLLSSFELGLVGPLLHDFLYGCAGKPGEACVPEREYTRKEADDLFREVMEREGVPAWRRQVAYRAVRWFGLGAWRNR